MKIKNLLMENIFIEEEEKLNNEENMKQIQPIDDSETYDNTIPINCDGFLKSFVERYFTQCYYFSLEKSLCLNQYAIFHSNEFLNI